MMTTEMASGMLGVLEVGVALVEQEALTIASHDFGIWTSLTVG